MDFSKSECLKPSSSSIRGLSTSSSFSSSFSLSFSSSLAESSATGRTLTDSASLNRTISKRSIVTKSVAASYYQGDYFTISQMSSTKDISELNNFLRDTRSEIEAGFLERRLTVIIGDEGSDLGSMVAAITYAFLLATVRRGENRCVVPVMNLKRADLTSHPEAVWLFDVSGIDTAYLLFVDEINLQYHITFGNLSLVLVNHSKLSSKQQNLEAAIIEIIDNQEVENPYPLVEDVHYDQVGSCSTLIAERCAMEAPELLLDHGMSRLLLAAILLNTSNLSKKNGRCTQRDECMATLLLHGAGRLGHTGFFQELRLQLSDLSMLSSEEILSRNFKQWKSKPGMRQRTSFSSIGMSSLRISLVKFISRDSAVIEDLSLFLKSQKLQLLIIATGYYNVSKILVREVLMASQNRSLIDEFLQILDSEDVHLQLKPLLIPGLPNWAMAFSQRNVRVSRKQMQYVLENIFTS